MGGKWAIAYCGWSSKRGSRHWFQGACTIGLLLPEPALLQKQYHPLSVCREPGQVRVSLHLQWFAYLAPSPGTEWASCANGLLNYTQVVDESVHLDKTSHPPCDTSWASRVKLFFPETSFTSPLNSPIDPSARSQGQLGITQWLGYV